MIARLLAARQRDLADNELDIHRHSEKLVALMKERANINEDIEGLNKRLDAKGERNIDATINERLYK